MERKRERGRGFGNDLDRPLSREQSVWRQMAVPALYSGFIRAFRQTTRRESRDEVETAK